MDYSIIIPIIVAVVMSIPGIYTAFVQTKKEDSVITKTAQDAALEIINPLREEIKSLREEVKIWRDRVRELECLVDTKDNRIEELERMVSERDVKIEGMEKEILELRNRVEKVESRNPKTQPLPRKKGE